jgi:NAD(P)-dependent dehydrogenase (short-subunit alcohol dehydrogenase family)
MSDEFSLNGKIALVAGEGRFWSKYVAEALASAGSDVVIAAQDLKTLEETASEVKRLGRKVLPIPTDLTDSAQVQDMVEQVITEFGMIDILVNVSDLQFAKPFLEVTKDEWQRVMAGNVTPTFLCCQAVGKRMLGHKKGRIINITSCLADRGVINGTAYCAAMGCVLQLSRALALEWVREGITVNVIGAGWFSEVSKAKGPDEERLLRYIPVKRYGHPSEIGSLVVYIASDASSYLTGQYMSIDGGVSIHL